MAAPGMTRDEKRARTVTALLEAAAGVFARQGYQAASLDEIAEAAGYSKGAIYSNFDSKEDLFLAVLDRHDAEQSVSLERALAAGDDLHSRLVALSMWFRHQVETERDWALLNLEFTMAAARNERLRERLASRMRDVHRTLGALVAEQAGDLGLELPVPAQDVARIVSAMGNGIMTARLIDPDDPLDDLFASGVALVLGQDPADARSCEDGPPTA